MRIVVIQERKLTGPVHVDLAVAFCLAPNGLEDGRLHPATGLGHATNVEVLKQVSFFINAFQLLLAVELALRGQVTAERAVNKRLLRYLSWMRRDA